jgi:ubiquinone/menaquinone biosynthesis C-methylase UbiE
MDSPKQQLLQMLTSYWISQTIHVAAKLGIADLVKDKPKTAAELAQATKTHAPSLHRLLRGLASVGIFAADDAGRFGLTEMARCLLDEPLSQRAVAIMMGDEHYASWGHLFHSVQTGKPAFDHLFGKPIFDWYSEHPEQAKIFDAAMTGFHGEETQKIIDAYDFAPFKTVVDIGGGNGSVLTPLLLRYPSARGILFDLAGVIERAKPNLAKAGLGQRCQAVAGNFFESVVAGGDAYLMRHIIHDWTDEQSLTILRNIRKVIAAHGKLLVIEMVIPPGNEPHFGKLLDLNMLVIPGGQERTEAEYRRLYADAGFQLERVVPTKAEVSIVEGRPV